MKQTTLLVGLALIASPAIAEQMPLSDYLASMDRQAVTFSGSIRYDSRDRAFTFFDDEREPFGVTLDAGREERERIETECEGFSWGDFCAISGSGTVEIRGSRVFISIDTVDQLTKP